MPRFEQRPKPEKGKENLPAAPVGKEMGDPRCKACTSASRRAIDRLLILPNVNLSEIERMFGVPRRSLANHAASHLNYEDAAIRRLIEQEAQAADLNLEEGIKGAIAHRVFLSSFIHKANEALLEGDLEITAKDAMQAISMMETSANKTTEAEVAEIRHQFNMFLQAMHETLPREMAQQVLARVRQLMADGNQPPRLEE